jgi:hypothetical protein
VTGALSVSGGSRGENSGYNDEGGHGGEGRVRVDGDLAPSLSAGPTGQKGSTHEGCAVTT